MLFKGSFEDYLYILIGIVWIAFSIYRGTQKNKTKQSEAKSIEPKAEKKSVFETFIDNILVEQKAETYPSASEEIIYNETDVEVPEKENEIFSYDDYYEESNFQEDKDVYQDKVESSLKVDQNPEASPSVKRKKPRIDLKKAVVYSEILNKRYF